MMTDQKAFDLVKTLYRNDAGEPFEMTESQIKIFRAIYEKQYPRLQIACYSQFGKSEIVSMAILTRVSTFSEKWAIIAPTVPKAKILIGYMIKHIFENDYTRKKFSIGSEESEERIRRERSKSKLTFKNSDGIGEVFILSSESSKKGSDAGDILLGHGSSHILIDESALIPDRVMPKIIRMLAGHQDSTLIKIGNTIRRNHFFKTHNSPRYHKIFVDCYQGLKEGRLNQEQIDELKRDMDTMNFSMLYECKFPPEDAITGDGWMPTISDDDIDRQIINEPLYPIGDARLGIDVSGGGRNYSVIVLRYDNFAQIVFKGKTKDTMDLVSKALHIRRELKRIYGVRTWLIVDAIGIGKGVYDALKSQVPDEIIGVIGGEKAKNDKEFFNLRAENYWKITRDILGGLKLVRHDGWNQLKAIKYKYSADRRIKIISKEDLLLEGIESPDDADALSMTSMIKMGATQQITEAFSYSRQKDNEIY